MSQQEYRSYLIRAMRTLPADIDPHSEFCQAYKETDENGVTREWEMPDKLRAAQLLAQHCDWNEPTRVAPDTTDTVTALLQSIRKSQDYAPWSSARANGA